ncbi:MAG: hypothetical protein ACRC62_15815 [Microcoleus sp.]
MRKPPLNLKSAQKSNGFQQIPTFCLIVHGCDGWVFDVPYQVDMFRRPEQTNARAIAIAQLIFSFLLNCDDENVRAKLVESVGDEFVGDLQSISREFNMATADSFFWGRIANGDRKPLRHRRQYFDVFSVAAIAATADIVQTVDIDSVAAIANL